MTAGATLVEEGVIPVFLVGFPRSGTTMLAAALGRHSKIAATPETMYFENLNGRLDRMIRSGAASAVIAAECCADARFQDLCASESELHSLLRVSTPKSGADVLRLVLEEYAAQKNAALVVEKSPIHLLHLREISEKFPDARFIVILRDGRDCALSLMRVPWAHSSLARHSAEWLYRMKLFIEAREFLADRLLVVKYEDVVSNPKPVLTEVCKYLGVDYQETMRQASESRTAVVPEWELGWKANAEKAIGDSRAGGWRTTASPEDIAVMNHVMGDMLSALRYEGVKKGPLRLRDRLSTRSIYSEAFYPWYRSFMLWLSALRVRLSKSLGILKK